MRDRLVATGDFACCRVMVTARQLLSILLRERKNDRNAVAFLPPFECSDELGIRANGAVAGLVALARRIARSPGSRIRIPAER